MSQTLIVHLFVVSMASRLARNSRISHSTAGSGMGLSLLLNNMVVIFFSATEIKEFFLCSDTTTGADLRPSS
jgi:phosphatidylserine synthase